MPRGGARPGAGRKPKIKPAGESAPAPKKVKAPAKAKAFSADGKRAADAPPGWPFGTSEPGEKSPSVDPDLSELTPLAFLLEVMRDPQEERRTRLQAAQLAAPYCHVKKGEGGKKSDKEEAAKKVAAGRFGAAAPPRLVARNG